MSNTTFKKLGLLLDTSTEPTHLVLIEEKTPLTHCSIEGKESCSRFLVMRLHQFLSSERYALSDLGFIGASQGPGSYTSLRVGATVAKSLAFALKIPLISFCSLKMYTPSSDGTFFVAMDANTRGVYALEGEKKGSCITCGNPALIAHKDVPHLFAKSSQQICPKGDSLVQKFAAFPFIENTPNLHQMAEIAMQELIQKPPHGPYPKLDLLYL